MKWTQYDDSDFMKQTVHKLCVDSNDVYHSVRVFTVKKMHPVAMLKRTQHTAQVCCGPYGETVYEVELPFGTNVKDARAKAEAMARETNERGLSKFSPL